jgi:hypothetical protein
MKEEEGMPKIRKVGRKLFAGKVTAEERRLSSVQSTSLLAGVRSPQEVLEIVLTPDQAKRAVDKLRQAMLCVPDTMLAVVNGELVWLWSDPANRKQAESLRELAMDEGGR